MTRDLEHVDPRMRELHALCSKNKKAITNSGLVGCFFCCSIQKAEDVEEYSIEADGSETAICPICGVDSVIGDASTPINKEMLQTMCKTWF